MPDVTAPAARPARERVLDAYTDLLERRGERAATLDAVARAAGVSKGGLLYHFATKHALEAGLLARLDTLVTADLAVMRTAPEGPVEHFLRSSASDDTPFDRTLRAVARLSQSSDAARQALADVNTRWLAQIRDAVGDDDLARTILLISDGIYYGSALLREQGDATAGPGAREIDAAVRVIRRLAGNEGDGADGSRGSLAARAD